MAALSSKKFTKDDFLNYEKLAEKLGADPEEVYEVMRHHYKVKTPVRNQSGSPRINSQLIVRTGDRKSASHRIKKTDLQLHPMGFDAFVEMLQSTKRK